MQINLIIDTIKAKRNQQATTKKKLISFHYCGNETIIS